MASKKKLRRRIAELKAENERLEHDNRILRLDMDLLCPTVNYTKADKPIDTDRRKPECDVTDEEHSELVNTAFNRSLGTDLGY